MIQVDSITINGRILRKTWSDDNFYIRKVGTEEVYAEAYDVPGSFHEYEETDEKIEEDEEEE